MRACVVVVDREHVEQLSALLDGLEGGAVVAPSGELATDKGSEGGLSAEAR